MLYDRLIRTSELERTGLWRVIPVPNGQTVARQVIPALAGNSGRRRANGTPPWML